MVLRALTKLIVGAFIILKIKEEKEWKDYQLFKKEKI